MRNNNMIELGTIVSYTPLLLLPFLITMKILLGKKFSNRIFYPLLVILLVLSAITIGIIFYIVQPSYNPEVTVTLIQKINTVLSGIFTIYFPLFNILLLVFYPIIFVLSIVLCKKYQEKTILKKLGFSTIFLGIIFLFSTPTIICPDLMQNYEKKTQSLEILEKEITKSKLAARYAILPPMRAHYIDLTALNISLYISEKYDYEKLPKYSAPEVTQLMQKYIAYKEKSAELLCYNEYIILSAFCTKIGYLDEALKYAKLAEEKGVYTKSLEASIYIAKGEYEKALNLVDKNSRFWGDKRKLAAIYIGLKEFENAKAILNEPEGKFDHFWKPKTQIYYHYQKGDKKIAKKLFEEYKKTSNKFNSYTLEEFIQYNDRIDY